MKSVYFRLAAIFAAISACSSPSGGDSPASGRGGGLPVPVTVATVVEKDAPVQIRAIGIVEAYSTVTVKSQVPGQLAEIHFAEGQEVKKGDLLFTVDPRPFATALRQAKANRARDLAEAKNAGVEAERLAKLFAEGFVSREEHDQAEARAASLKALVKSDDAAEETARLRLEYCFIHSPIDGRVGQLLVHAGNLAKENETALAVVHQIRPVYVRFSVPEQDLPRIRLSLQTQKPAVDALAGGAGSDHPARGELSFVDNSVDATTATVLLKGLFPNDEETLWPGQFVNVALTLSIRSGALMVPKRAIITGQQGRYAFVVSADGTVESRTVIEGDAIGEEIVIENGLHLGERVVTDGQIRLAPGAQVEIQNGSPAAAGEKPPGESGSA